MDEIKKYGYFDDHKREYVVTNPYPPTTWINYLSNGRLCTMLSQGGGGMTFLDSAASVRFTRYKMSRSVPTDRPGHYVYIREKDGTLWSPTYEPVRTELDNWKCRHGLGYSIFEGSYKGMDAKLKFFIHPDHNVLIWDLELENNRENETELMITPYVEFSFLDAHEEAFSFHWCRMANSFTYDKELGAVKYYYGAPYYEYPRTQVFMSGSEMPQGFDCDRDSFMGRRGTEERPEAVVDGKLTNSELPGGGHGAGALQYNISLKVGEKKRMCFYLGGIPTWEEADKLIASFKNTSLVDEGFRKLTTFYDEYVGKMQIEVPDKDMERFVNIWNPYNCRQSFERARFVSAIHTGMGGGMQSRDSMQDALSITYLKPEWTRERIAVIMRYQHPDGRFIDTFDPKLGKEPEDTGRRCDNGVWSIYTVYGYLAESGDLDFLKEKIPYYKGEQATIFMHLWLAMRYMTENQGDNGLPLMFGQDWNDSLNMFKEEGAETVMLAQQIVYACTLFKEISKAYDNNEAVKWCENTKKRLIKAINNDTVWDGEWYKRILYKNGRTPLGSKERSEAKIYLNSQSWAVISGAAPEERAKQCMDSAREHLNTPYGLKLLWPPYTGIPEPPHPLVANVPGVSENGGIFNHANTWAIIAEACLGRGNKAYEYYHQCLPPVVINKVGIETYKNEPYCYSSHIIAEPDERAGMALLSWLSGTTTWMYIAATQYIMGIRPTLSGLCIDPCIPSNWKGFKVKRNNRGILYDITVNNPEGVQKGIKIIEVDGITIEGNIIPIASGKACVKVVVTMG